MGVGSCCCTVLWIGASEVEAMGAGTQIGLLIREDVGFEDCAICVDGAFVRASERFVGWSDLCELLCAASRYFISITSASMMKLTTAGGTGCPFRRSVSCHTLMKHKENIKSMKTEKKKSGINRKSR